MVALHAALLIGCVAEPLAAHRAFLPALGYPMLAIVIAANALRWWCIATLGGSWTARVIVVPGRPLVTACPYRWFAHPNYAAVIIEGAALPLVGSAWITAVSFTLANAILAHRPDPLRGPRAARRPARRAMIDVLVAAAAPRAWPRRSGARRRAWR